MIIAYLEQSYDGFWDCPESHEISDILQFNSLAFQMVNNQICCETIRYFCAIFDKEDDIDECLDQMNFIEMRYNNANPYRSYLLNEDASKRYCEYYDMFNGCHSHGFLMQRS